jgi:hypothetical protein
MSRPLPSGAVLRLSQKSGTRWVLINCTVKKILLRTKSDDQKEKNKKIRNHFNIQIRIVQYLQFKDNKTVLKFMS